MADKSTRFAGPYPTFRFVFVTAFWTVGTCSPFRATEAQNAGVGALVTQVCNVLAILPLRHPLVMFTSGWTLAHPIRVANVHT
jgi:hypothetical protein